MNFRNHVGILSFDEFFFPKEPNARTLVICITRFAYVIIIGFDPSVVEVRNLAIGITQPRIFMKATLWTKTRPGTNEDNGPSSKPNKLGSSTLSHGPLENIE